MLCREHLTIEGLQKLVAIKASMNLGLSDELKAAFPDTIAVQRPLVQNKIIEDPNWLAGFTTAEGCFMVSISASKTNSSGFKVELTFQLTQHARDEKLMRSLIKFLDCGKVSKRLDGCDFKVRKFNDLTGKIIPFFQKYPIQGIKGKDLEDFYKVAELMKMRAHLTSKGLELVRQIKVGMNTGRDWN